MKTVTVGLNDMGMPIDDDWHFNDWKEISKGGMAEFDVALEDIGYEIEQYDTGSDMIAWRIVRIGS